MVVKQTKASAHHGLRVRRPCEANAWRKVVLLVKSGIVIPAQAGIYREIVTNFPIVLNPEAVVVVAEMNFVGLGGEASPCEEQEKTGIDRAELLKVGLSGKELVVLKARLYAIYLSAFIVPTEFDGMAIDRLGQAGAEGAVFLFQSGGRECGTVAELPQVAEDPTSIETAEKVEERVGTGIRVGGAGKHRFVAILAAEAKYKWTAGVAKSSRVAEAQKKVALAQICAC